jgi:hypothetical protein
LPQNNPKSSGMATLACKGRHNGNHRARTSPQYQYDEKTNTPTPIYKQRAFAVLPLELLLHVLDQLVGTCNRTQPIAYGPSHVITKTLRNFTLVSRNMYPVASRYLYSHCLYLSNCTNYTCLRRTLGLNLGSHPQSLSYGESGRNDQLFEEIPRYITSAFISPMKTEQDVMTTPLVRLFQVIDLCKVIGLTLKRLAIDLQPVYTSGSEIVLVKPYLSENNIFLHMPSLEELIVSYDALDYFPFAPPNLKRMAITFQELKDAQIDFCFSTSSLETLVFLRPPELLKSDIDRIFSSYKGKSLDVILVDVNSNHRTPAGTRSWTNDDTVKIWELDVPTSYYGDEDELVICDDYIWAQGVQGTLWSQSKRRMASWADIQRKLAGPVHLIMDSASA